MYNTRHLITNIQSSTLGGFGFSYDGAQRRTGMSFPNNHTGSYTYDNASRPTAVNWNTAAPSLITSQSLTWKSADSFSQIR